MRLSLAVVLVMLGLVALALAQPTPPTGVGLGAGTTATLTVTVSGSGTVSGPGITSCTASSGDCTESYPTGVTTVLSATAASGFTFTGWSGACSGTGTCSVAMSSAQAVTATFTSTSEPTNGTAYYVSPSGSSSNSCTTASTLGATDVTKRKQTIAQGIACLTSGGNTVVIGAGTYTESISDTIPSGSGAGGEAAEATWSSATIIRAESPCSGTTCTTIIHPSSCSVASDVITISWFAARSYIILRGFEVNAGSCVQAIRIGTTTGANHIRIQKTYIHDALAAQGGSGMIAALGTTHLEVLDSVITRYSMAGSFPTAGGNHCLYWNSSGTIRRNIISYCSPTDGNGQAIATHSGPGSYVVDISANDISFFGYQGIEAASTLNTKIYNNTVHDGSTLGCNFPGFGSNFFCAGITASGDSGAPVNTLIANNTVYNVSSGIGGGIVIQGSGTATTTIQNNILYGGTSNTVTGTSDGGTITNNRCDSVTARCSTTANPQFVNAPTPTSNFHLTSSSPTTITQGGVNLNSSFTTDKDSVTWGSTWGLGAYKF